MCLIFTCGGYRTIASHPALNISIQYTDEPGPNKGEIAVCAWLSLYFLTSSSFHLAECTTKRMESTNWLADYATGTTAVMHAANQLVGY